MAMMTSCVQGDLYELYEDSDGNSWSTEIVGAVYRERDAAGCNGCVLLVSLDVFFAADGPSEESLGVAYVEVFSVGVGNKVHGWPCSR